MYFNAISSPIIPNGMLRKNADGQPKLAIKIPPITGPTAIATPPTPPQTPNALARSAGSINIP
jgi:hypothetical protein